MKHGKNLVSCSRKANTGEDQQEFCMRPPNLKQRVMKRTAWDHGDVKFSQHIHPRSIIEKPSNNYWAQKANLLAAIAAEKMNSLAQDRAVFCQVSFLQLSTQQVLRHPDGSRNPQTGPLSPQYPSHPHSTLTAQKKSGYIATDHTLDAGRK